MSESHNLSLPSTQQGEIQKGDFITIQTSGSFQSPTKTFRADHHGHAEAVAQAWLAGSDDQINDADQVFPNANSSRVYPGAASDDACYPRRMRHALDAASDRSNTTLEDHYYLGCEAARVMLVGRPVEKWGRLIGRKKHER